MSSERPWVPGVSEILSFEGPEVERQRKRMGKRGTVPHQMRMEASWLNSSVPTAMAFVPPWQAMEMMGASLAGNGIECVSLLISFDPGRIEQKKKERKKEKSETYP